MTDPTNAPDTVADIDRLRGENASLKQLLTDLVDAATRSRDREMTWVFALEGNRDGVWDWNAVTNEVFFSRRWKEMLGYAEGEISNNLSEWDSRVHPDDRDAVYADLGRHMAGEVPFYQNEHRVRCKDGSYKWILDRGKVVSWTAEGKPLRVVGTHSDITLRKEAEIERERLLLALQEANGKIKVLSGLLPICASCKRIRDEEGRWESLETFIEQHSSAAFSHGLCPVCTSRLYPGVVGPAAR